MKEGACCHNGEVPTTNRRRNESDRLESLSKYNEVIFKNYNYQYMICKRFHDFRNNRDMPLNTTH